MNLNVSCCQSGPEEARPEEGIRRTSINPPSFLICPNESLRVVSGPTDHPLRSTEVGASEQIRRLIVRRLTLGSAASHQAITAPLSRPWSWAVDLRWKGNSKQKANADVYSLVIGVLTVARGLPIGSPTDTRREGDSSKGGRATGVLPSKNHPPFEESSSLRRIVLPSERQRLKKTKISPWIVQSWCIPPEGRQWAKRRSETPDPIARPSPTASVPTCFGIGCEIVSGPGDR